MDRDRYLLFVSALTACHAQETHEVTIAAIPSLPLAPPNASSTFCESLAKKNDSLLAQPEVSEASQQDRTLQCGDEDKRVRALLVNPVERPAFLSYCHTSQGGTWAVMLMSVSLDDPGGEGPPCGWAATYKLVHVRDGAWDTTKTKGVATSSPLEYLHWLNEYDEYKVVRLIDYDHDGQDELVLSETKWQNGACAGVEDCNQDEATDEIWTAIGDKVTAYRPPSPRSK